MGLGATASADASEMSDDLYWDTGSGALAKQQDLSGVATRWVPFLFMFILSHSDCV